MVFQQGDLLAQQDNVAVLETVCSIWWTHHYGIFGFTDGRFFVLQDGLRLQLGGLNWLELMLLLLLLVGTRRLAGSRMSSVVELGVGGTPAQAAGCVSFELTGQASQRLRLTHQGTGPTQERRRLLLVRSRQSAHCGDRRPDATWE